MTSKVRFIEGSDGNRLFTQCWGDDVNPKAVLILSHGLAEHSGRYAHVGDFFAQQGFLVCALDHRSHGQSEGEDTYVDSFDQFLADLDIFVKFVKEKAPGKPTFLLGHSMGGAIVLSYVIKYQPELTGVILSAPGVLLGGDISPILLKIAGLLSVIAPKMKTITLDAGSVSRDPEVMAKYDADPLNYRGGVPARLGAEMNKNVAFVAEHMKEFTLPCFLANGSEDKLVDPTVSQYLYDGVGSEDKTIKVYEGLYHEILNEPEKEEVMGDMLTWMNNRI